MAVHIYGNMCDMDELSQISKEFNIPIIEDSAEESSFKARNTTAEPAAVPSEPRDSTTDSSARACPLQNGDRKRVMIYDARNLARTAARMMPIRRINVP